jgi:2-oxoisovalerate ferredoxin oxidoreductase beta subunit
MSTITDGSVLQWPDSLYRTFERKPGGQESTHYCPGCGHGVLHKLIAEAMDDLGIRDRTVFISPVGCSVFGYYYFNCGNVQVAHGRAPAVATGLKRALPHSIVISYQGDGDLAAIGTSNILHAANRGEAITVFFVNNAIYGMTGGQMAPTTLHGQRTATTPRGRDTLETGAPLRMSELLSTLHAPVYIERVALTDANHIMSARKAVRKALKAQVDGKGFSMVEVLSSCPVGWKMEPAESKTWITEHLIPHFPLGVFKDVLAEREPRVRAAPGTGAGQGGGAVRCGAFGGAHRRAELGRRRGAVPRTADQDRRLRRSGCAVPRCIARQRCAAPQLPRHLAACVRT